MRNHNNTDIGLTFESQMDVVYQMDHKHTHLQDTQKGVCWIDDKTNGETNKSG